MGVVMGQKVVRPKPDRPYRLLRLWFNGLVPPETQGWLKDGDGYSIEWEAPDTRLKIQGTLDFLGKGCSCKIGYKTKRCSCQKNAKECGAGCECKGCTNMKLTVMQQDELSEE